MNPVNLPPVTKTPSQRHSSLHSTGAPVSTVQLPGWEARIRQTCLNTLALPSSLTTLESPVDSEMSPEMPLTKKPKVIKNHPRPPDKNVNTAPDGTYTALARETPLPTLDTLEKMRGASKQEDEVRANLIRAAFQYHAGEKLGEWTYEDLAVYYQRAEILIKKTAATNKDVLFNATAKLSEATTSAVKRYFETYRPTCLQNHPAQNEVIHVGSNRGNEVEGDNKAPDAQEGHHDFIDFIICAADKFCAFAKRDNVLAIQVYKECAKLIDSVLDELERAGKDLDDCPGILEPVNADDLRKSIQAKLTEVFLLQAQAPPYRISPGEELLTLDQVKAKIQRIQRHFNAFVYFGEGYGPDFFDACREAHQAQLRRTQARCEELAGWELRLLHNPTQRQLSQLHGNLPNQNRPKLPPQFSPLQFSPQQQQLCSLSHVNPGQNAPPQIREEEFFVRNTPLPPHQQLLFAAAADQPVVIKSWESLQSHDKRNRGVLLEYKNAEEAARAPDEPTYITTWRAWRRSLWDLSDRECKSDYELLAAIILIRLARKLMTPSGISIPAMLNELDQFLPPQWPLGLTESLDEMEEVMIRDQFEFPRYGKILELMRRRKYI
jgi:hypothetical protein